MLFEQLNNMLARRFAAVAQLDNRGDLGEGETRALRIANEAQAVDCVGPVLAVSVGAAFWGEKNTDVFVVPDRFG